MDRETAKAYRERAVKVLEAEFGANSIVNPSVRFDTTGLSFKVEIREVAPGESARDVGRKRWNEHCHHFGLVPEDFDRGVVHRDADGGLITLEIQDIDIRSRRYPIIAVDSAGKKLRFSRASLVAKIVAAALPEVTSSASLPSKVEHMPVTPADMDEEAW